MDETEIETPSLLNKPTSELTVGEALQMNVMAAVAIATIPIAIKGITVGVKHAWSWNKSRKAENELTVVPDTE